MKIQNIKGGTDFLPKEQRIRNYINDTLKEIFIEYGYNPIETPILMYYDILSDKYDEENDILKEIYKLTDQGNRKLGLRYDLTVPFSKLIALNKNNIKLPFKRYEIAKVFRDGPVKVGRDREFTQCDVDVVGISGQMIEAEMLSLYVEAFKRLNIEIIIKYNSRQLMSGLIKECNIEEEKVSKVITIIDKLEKVTIDELKDYFREIEIEEEKIDKLLKYFTLSLDELNKEFAITTNENIIIGLEELNILNDYLKALEIDNYCKFVSTLARGQDYYTGNVFEVYERNMKLSGSIGGGGRYDKIITNFISDGNIYPAVGISFGLSSIYELLKNDERFKSDSDVDIYVIPMNTKMESLKLANKLRNMGYKVELEMIDKKLKKSLDFANKEKIPYVIILGEDEIANNCFKVKDMFNNKEFEVLMNNLEVIKEYIEKE